MINVHIYFSVEKENSVHCETLSHSILYNDKSKRRSFFEWVSGIDRCLLKVICSHIKVKILEPYQRTLHLYESSYVAVI